MTRTSTQSGVAAKPARFRKRNQKVAQPDAVSPLMQKLRGALGERKGAEKLAFLTSQPLSNCQKMLSGNRMPNPAMIAALFADELIIDAILGLIPEDATHPKVRAVRKAMRRLELDFEDTP